MVVVHCQDSWLTEQGDLEAIRQQIRTAAKDAFPGAGDPFAYLQSITQIVVFAPYVLTFEVAKLFLPAAKELLIDPTAIGLPPTVSESTITDWLVSCSYASKRVKYYDRGPLNYSFNCPPDRVLLAVVPDSYYQTVVNRGWRREHIACWVGGKKEERKGKIYIDLKGRRVGERYWVEERAASLVVGVDRDVKSLLKNESEKPQVSASFPDSLFSKISEQVSHLSSEFCSPPQLPSLPLVPTFPAAPLLSAMQEYSEGMTEALRVIERLRTKVAEP